MLVKGDSVLVAFSGGPDSVVLLDVLERLKIRYGVRLCVAHFNHKLRGQAADEDAEFAERVARQKKLMFVGSSADVAAFASENKLSVEAAGRKLRYEFFFRSSLSVGATKVALGHTADDQAETILMRLIRGAGPEGLAGIPPVRLLNEQGGPRIIRPLIHTWRADIMRYVSGRRLEFRTDVSNEAPEYFRNKIRLELLPRLEREYNPQIKQRLAAAASALAAENDFLAAEARLLSREAALEQGRQWVVFDTRMLVELHPALRKRILSHLLKMVQKEPPMLEAAHFLEADALLFSGGRIDLPGRLRLEVSEGAGLIAAESARPVPSKQSFPIKFSGVHPLPELNLVVRTETLKTILSPQRLAKSCTASRQYFDLKAVRPPLEVRVKRPGDTFHPMGMAGSKKLKDYFIDKKVPRFLRQHIPLLVSQGRIVWVMGYAIDERFKLKPNSQSALRVDYERSTPGAFSSKGKNR